MVQFLKSEQSIFQTFKDNLFFFSYSLAIYSVTYWHIFFHSFGYLCVKELFPKQTRTIQNNFKHESCIRRVEEDKKKSFAKHQQLKQSHFYEVRHVDRLIRSLRKLFLNESFHDCHARMTYFFCWNCLNSFFQIEKDNTIKFLLLFNNFLFTYLWSARTMRSISPLVTVNKYTENCLTSIKDNELTSGRIFVIDGKASGKNNWFFSTLFSSLSAKSMSHEPSVHNVVFEAIKKGHKLSWFFDFLWVSRMIHFELKNQARWCLYNKLIERERNANIVAASITLGLWAKRRKCTFWNWIILVQLLWTFSCRGLESRVWSLGSKLI